MKTKYKLFRLISLLVMLSCSQNADNSESKIKEEKEADKRYFAELEANALKKPYKGVFSDEGKVPGLFPVYSTGISTDPIVSVAVKFLESLSPNQIEKSTFPIDDEEWRKWCNVDNGIYVRQGVSLKEMSAQQKSAAFGLIQTSLSARGFQLSNDIMKTDHTLKELNNGSSDYDEELYFFTIMGKPSSTGPWGWQLDGHHLIINYFVLGDQVVMSPVFMGAEPVITTTGKYKGNTLFQDEQNLGLALIGSLSIEQQKKAIISDIKTGNNNKASANKDNINLNYKGLKVSDLTKKQRNDLLDLIFQYISNMREGHQKIKMEEVIEHLDDSWFSWIGDISDDAVFYYRIHSPVVLIEFDHQIAVGVPYERTGKPTRNHIHTVVRTPNGNDYGKDLLRQHLETHPH